MSREVVTVSDEAESSKHERPVELWMVVEVLLGLGGSGDAGWKGVREDGGPNVERYSTPGVPGCLGNVGQYMGEVDVYTPFRDVSCVSERVEMGARRRGAR